MTAFVFDECNKVEVLEVKVIDNVRSTDMEAGLDLEANENEELEQLKKAQSVDAEAGEDVENLKNEYKDVPIITVKEKITLIFAAATCVCIIFIAVFFVVFFAFPACLENPNPARLVHLDKTEAGYGMDLDANKIAYITPGGPAYMSKLERGDSITSVNGVNVVGMRADRIKALVQTRDVDVKLTVVARYPEASFEQRFTDAMRTASNVSLVILIVVVIIICSKRNGLAKQVVLFKEQGGYGLKVIGYSIIQVSPGGPADVQGELKRGDVIVAINGVRTQLLGNRTIKELFETRDGNVKLAIKSAK